MSVGQPPSSGRRAAGGASRTAQGVGRFAEWSTRPLRRMYASLEPLDRYSLVHMASVAGDTCVAIALADSVFFSVPVGEAKLKVALWLAVTMAPLALAAPLLVPLLDRGGFRRAIAFSAAAGRGLVAVVAAPRFDTAVLFPAAFALLALARVHGITKNGLTMAYADSDDALMHANAKIGRQAAVAAALAALPALLVLQVGGSEATLYLAAVGYVTTAVLVVVRLPRANAPFRVGEVTKLGKMPSLATPAAGTAGLRAASGFLLLLLAIALRNSGQPAYWFGLLAAAATGGVALGDLIAPRLPSNLREEAVVLGSLITAGVAAIVAFQAFTLIVLMLFALVAGAATEFGRIAFQSLMQKSAPGGYHGRVFVRYEVVFQLAWVAGALAAAIIPFSFRAGVLSMGAFYIVFGLAFVIRPFVRKEAPPGPPPVQPRPPAPGV